MRYTTDIVIRSDCPIIEALNKTLTALVIALRQCDEASSSRIRIIDQIELVTKTIISLTTKPTIQNNDSNSKI